VPVFREVRGAGGEPEHGPRCYRDDQSQGQQAAKKNIGHIKKKPAQTRRWRRGAQDLARCGTGTIKIADIHVIGEGGKSI